ncbi:MAG: site-specific integrase, partial [Chloroflexi bacterium]|nr:site-specific integrase [Chloroflexota bacterium]
MNTPLTNDGSTASRSDVTHGLRSYNLDGNSSLRAAMDAFEAHMQQQGFSENTAKAFMSDLGILTQFIGAGTAVRHISTSDLNRFSEWLVADRGVPCSPKSLARRVTTLKVFFGWLSESG